MPQLVPRFILTRTGDRGSLTAAALRIDVTGFTAATSVLMEHGTVGAEIIADIMQAVFAPLVDAVEREAGFVATFSGDAFTALFPAGADAAWAAARHALAAASTMREHLDAHRVHRTRFGDFEFTARIGIDVGGVRWGIVRPLKADDSSTHAHNEVVAAYYFDGPAIAGAMKAEARAVAGEIVQGDGVIRLLDEARAVGMAVEQAPSSPRQVVTVEEPEWTDGEEAAAAAAFLPRTVTTRTGRGDFRPVVSVFIHLLEPTHESLAAFLQTVFSLQRRFGGYLNKVEFADKGCTVLLFWGAPLSGEKDLTAALAFLLELQEVSTAIFRAGVTHRQVYAGLIGSSRRGEYTCYGDAVNLAARLMSAAPPGEVWTEELVARRAERGFILEARGEHRLKGFPGPVPVAALVGRRTTGPTLSETSTVGRGAERAAALDFVRSALRRTSVPTDAIGAARVLLISGEAGLGKSHLVHEVLLDPELRDAAQVFTGQTDQIIRQAYNPFRYWLTRYFGQLTRTEDTDRKRTFDAKLDSLLAETADLKLRDALDQQRSVLGALVDLRWEGSLYEDLDPQGRRDNTILAIQRLLRAEAMRRPVVFVLEDAHWLDDGSRELLSVISEGVIDVPIALIVTTRTVPGRRSPLDNVAHEHLELSPLTTAMLSDLAAARLGAPLGSGLEALLDQRAEGNPFFAEQIVQHLFEEDALEQVDGQWELAAGAASAVIPDDLRLLFISRLDRLAERLKRTVQAAAVLGREFEVRALTHMLRDEADVRRSLAAGEDESIWAALHEFAYLFRHALLRDAAYEMQLVIRRRALHQAAAEALETLHASSSSLPLAEIAHHYETACRLGAAELTEPARRYLRLAAEDAAQRFENDTAVEGFGRALALTHDSEERTSLLLARESILHLIGERLAQREDLDRLAEMAETQGDRRLAATVAHRLARYLTAVGEALPSSESAERAVSLARAAGDRRIEASALCAWGDSLWVLSRTAEARERYSEALQVAREVGDRAGEVAALSGLATAAERDSDYRTAEALHRQAIEVARAAGDRRFEATTLERLGSVISAQSRYQESRAYLEEALDLTRAVGNRRDEAGILTILGEHAKLAGDLDAGLALLQEALSIHRSIHDRSGEALTLDKMGTIKLELAEHAESIRLQEQALAIVREIGDRHREGRMVKDMGTRLSAVGDLEGASRHYRQGLEICRLVGDRRGEADALFNLSTAAYSLGRLEEARALCEEARTIRKEIGERLGVAISAMFLGAILTALATRGSAADAPRAASEDGGTTPMGRLDQGGLLDAAEDALSEGLAIVEGAEMGPTAVLIQTHIAIVDLARGKLDRALEHIAPALREVEEGRSIGRINGLHCYRVLAAVGDPRAGPLLRETYERLLEEASNFPEGVAREQYLYAHPWNREIIALGEALPT